MDCIFCSIINQNPQNKIFENGAFVALLDLNPVSNGHVILVPRRHVETYFHLNETDVVEMHRAIGNIKMILDEKLKPDGYNIGVNDGEAAGATQKHLLVHLIPRYNGDVPNPMGGVRNILGVPEMPKQEAPKEEPKPEPKKEEPKVEVKETKEEKPKEKTWQDLLKENERRRKELERLTVRNKFK